MNCGVSDPVLIIGAGVAGMTAAVELADSGVKTVLVERSLTMGGNALDLYKAFPTGLTGRRRNKNVMFNPD